MIGKVNVKRVVMTAALIFGMAFVAQAARIPQAITGNDWSTVLDLALSGALAGLAAVVEAGMHLLTPGSGDPTAK